jgi:hypothetical protein
MRAEQAKLLFVQTSKSTSDEMVWDESLARREAMTYLTNHSFNTQSAIADRRFADILLHYSLSMLHSRTKFIRVLQKDVCKSAIGDRRWLIAIVILQVCYCPEGRGDAKQTISSYGTIA